MKYLALIYGDENRWAALGENERKAMYEQYRVLPGRRRQGRRRRRAADTKSATTVRVRTGRRRSRTGRPSSSPSRWEASSCSSATRSTKRWRWHSRSPARHRRRRGPTAARGGVAKYLLLLNGTTKANEAWERNTPEENAELRAQEIPKWVAFMGWAEEGLDLKGLELDGRTTAKSIRVPER